MTAHPGPGRQHLLLAPDGLAGRERRRRLYAELTALGWERQTPVFAVPYAANARRWRGITVPEQLSFGTRRSARTPQGERELSLRTVGTDFALVTGERLHQGGLDQLTYSLGYALDGDRTRENVLLAEGWARAGTENFKAFLDVVERWFGDVRFEVDEPAPSLRHLRCCALELRDAA